MDGKQTPERKGPSTKCFYLFNCDKTYDLKIVETLLDAIKQKSTSTIIDLKIEKEYFRLFQMSELSETIKSGPPMDYAIFVVHAHESRLSINEDNAGIGYAKIYRALRQATGDKVLVVIGGDDNYRDAAEEERSLISRWARRQVSSQFKQEFIDGRKSFIFSWDTAHRAIHEEALLHFLDPEKEGQTFVRDEQKPQSETSEAPVDGRQVYFDQTTNTESLRSDHFHEPAEEEVKCSNTGEPLENHTADHEARLGEPKVDSSSLPREQSTDTGVSESAYPGTTSTYKDPVWGLSAKLETVQGQPTDAAIDKDLILQTPGTKIAILGRDQSDGDIIKDLLGDEFLRYFCIGLPDGGKNYLQSMHFVRSCFIVVEAETILDEHNSLATCCKDLLLTARDRAEKNVVVIICNDKREKIQIDEDTIAGRIKEVLGDKGYIVWWKGNSFPQEQSSKQLLMSNRSESLPEGAVGRSVESRAQHQDGNVSTLLFKTRLRHGKISYQDKDLEVRAEGWAPPQQIVNDLLKKWRSTSDAELLIFRDNKTGEDRVVVNEGSTIAQITGTLKEVKDTLQNKTTSGCFSFLTKKTYESDDDISLD